MINGNSPLLKDISVTLNPDTPEWPGDTPFTCGWSSLMGAGASVNVSAFTSSPHVGTHADAPLHESFDFERHTVGSCLPNEFAVDFEDSDLYQVFN